MEGMAQPLVLSLPALPFTALDPGEQRIATEFLESPELFLRFPKYLPFTFPNMVWVSFEVIARKARPDSGRVWKSH